MTPSGDGGRRSYRWAILAAAIVLLLVAIPLLWDWNWLRPLVAAEASRQLGRPVAIGHLHIALSRQPLLTAEAVTIGNRPDLPQAPLLSITQVRMRLDGAELLAGTVRLIDLELDQPRAEIGAALDDGMSWNLSAIRSLPHIGKLVVNDGRIQIRNDAHQDNLILTIATPAAAPDGAETVTIDAAGLYDGTQLSGRFVGGSLLSLGGGDSPYPVDLNLHSGALQLTLKGTVDRPTAGFGAVGKFAIELRGEDLAHLDRLTGVDFAPSRRYHLTTTLLYADRKLHFQPLAGTIGASDFAGEIAVDFAGNRPAVTATIASRRAELGDLARFIGLAPQQGKAEQRLIPDTPIEMKGVRSLDMQVSYRAATVGTDAAPLNNAVVAFTAKNGRLNMPTLSFASERGEASAKLTVDAAATPHAVADIAFRRIDLKRFFPANRLVQSTGLIGGRAQLDASGTSLAAMLGQGNGQLQLGMSHGDLRNMLVSLPGADVASAVAGAIGLRTPTPILCVVGDFGLEQGLLKSRSLVFETAPGSFTGQGSIDLKRETISFRLTPQPGALHIAPAAGPIEISGPLRDPKVASVGPNSGFDRAVGVLLSPLDSLVQTIQDGIGQDSECDEALGALRKPAIRAPAK